MTNAADGRLDFETVRQLCTLIPDALTPTDEQRDVLLLLGTLLAHGRSLRLLSGAGCGKSTILQLCVDVLVNVLGIPEERILLATFNDSAAEKMREELSTAGFTRVEIKTYHSKGQDILRDHSSPERTVLSEPLSNALMRVSAAELDLEVALSPPAQSLCALDDMDVAEELQALVRTAKSLDQSPRELETALPPVSTLEAVAELLERVQTDAAFRAAVPTDEIGSSAATTITRLSEVVQTARTIQRQLGTSPLAAALEAYLAEFTELCVQQQEFLRDRVSQDALSQQELETTRLLLSATADSPWDQPVYNLRLARRNIYRVPTARLRNCVQEFLLIHALLPGYKQYEKLLTDCDYPFIDHSDQIREAVHLLDRPSVANEVTEQYDIILSDEVQDTSQLQFRLLSQLSDQGDIPVIAVGDILQSIYLWRGALPNNLLDRYSDWVGPFREEKLSWCFRSQRQEPLTVANALSRQISGAEHAIELQSHAEHHGTVPTALKTVAPLRYTGGVTTKSEAAQLVATRVDELITGESLFSTVDYEIERILIPTHDNDLVEKVTDELAARGHNPSPLGKHADIPSQVNLVLNYLESILATNPESAVLEKVLRELYGVDRAAIERTETGAASLPAGLQARGDEVTEPVTTPIDTAARQYANLVAACDRLATPAFVEEFMETIRKIDTVDITADEWRALYGYACVAASVGQTTDSTPVDVDRGDLFREAFEDEWSTTASSTDPDIIPGTIFKLKGDEGDIVLVPGLVSKFWRIRRSSFELMKYAFALPETKLTELDLLSIREDEERKVLHVGITRCRAQLHLIGGTIPTPHRSAPPSDATDVPILDRLPDGPDWTRPPWLDIWAEIESALPATAERWSP